jgi:hypothetical protein
MMVWHEANFSDFIIEHFLAAHGWRSGWMEQARSFSLMAWDSGQ